MSRRERVIVTIVLMSIVPGSWFGYLNEAIARYWIGACGALALVYSFRVYRCSGNIRVSNPATKNVWVMWIALSAFLVFGLFREEPLFMGKPTDGSEGFLLLSRHLRDFSGGLVFQFIGSLALAWSVLFLVRSQRAVILLVCGMVFNALILAVIVFVSGIMGSSSLFGSQESSLVDGLGVFDSFQDWVSFASLHLMLAFGLGCYYKYHPRTDGITLKGMVLVRVLWMVSLFLFMTMFLRFTLVGMVAAVFSIGVVVSYFVRRAIPIKINSLWITGISIIFILLVGLGVYSDFLSNFSSSEGSGEVLRADLLWNKDVGLAVDSVGDSDIVSGAINGRPILGWGLGGFPLLSAEPSKYTNDWLLFFVEMGIVGFFLFLFPLVHMSIYFLPQNNLTRFCRMGIILLMGIAFLGNPFSNSIILLSVLLVVSCDIIMGIPKDIVAS